MLHVVFACLDSVTFVQTIQQTAHTLKVRFKFADLTVERL